MIRIPNTRISPDGWHLRPYKLPYAFLFNWIKEVALKRYDMWLLMNACVFIEENSFSKYMVSDIIHYTYDIHLYKSSITFNKVRTISE